MQGYLSACLEIVLRWEGGLSMIRSDPGNWTGGKVGKGVLKGTNYGIAASAFPNLDIPNLTRAQAMAIYRQKYWNPIGGDALPAGVDLLAFDIAVNSGVSRATKWLKASAGMAPVQRIAYLDKARTSFWKSLKTWVTFGRGWANRENAVCQSALLMQHRAALVA
jgi:lysozyme family protein